jgi:hypothetical protein
MGLKDKVAQSNSGMSEISSSEVSAANKDMLKENSRNQLEE